jgi:hypothetical protein
LGRGANRGFQFQKRGQHFIGVHNETLSIVAVRVNNPDRSPLTVNGRNRAPTPSGFAQIVSDDFPVPYGLCWAVSLIGLSRSGGRIRTAASAFSVSQSNLAG